MLEDNDSERSVINPSFIIMTMHHVQVETKGCLYPEDEADGGHSRCGHDFGTVGHEVQQGGHDALRSVVKLVTHQ